MARMKKIGNILRGVGSNPDRDSAKGMAKNSTGNMTQASGYPGMAKTGYSGPMSKFGRNASGSHTAEDHTSHMDHQSINGGAPNSLAGLPGKGKMDGSGWPKGLKFQQSSGGTDWPNRTPVKGPGTGAAELQGTPKKGTPVGLVNAHIAGDGSGFRGAGKDTGLTGPNASLPGKGWPKSLRKDIAGHGTLAG